MSKGEPIAFMKNQPVSNDKAQRLDTSNRDTANPESGISASPPQFALQANSVAQLQTADGDNESSSAGTLTLTHGELTITGEGNDADTKYIHWPRTAKSGVTLGKGYDIGSRTAAQVISELTAAGMGIEQATKISRGVNKFGNDAGAFVTANKTSVGEIAKSVQMNLLGAMLPKYEAEAKDLATSSTPTKDSAGNYTNARGREIKNGVPEGTYKLSTEQWDNLHPAMIEFVTDLKYQGGYYLYSRIEWVNKALIDNDGDHLAQFKAVAAIFEKAAGQSASRMDTYGQAIGERAGNTETFYGQSSEDLKGATTRRNRIRLAYLKQVISALEAGKTVTFAKEGDDQTPSTPVNQPTNTNTSPSPVVKDIQPPKVVTTEEKVQEETRSGYSDENAVLAELITSGAGAGTTKQDGRNYNDVGVDASNRMASKDFGLLKRYVDVFIEAGSRTGYPPALLAAIASRESRGGSALDANGKGDHGHGFGLMQIDDRSHRAVGAWNSTEHIMQAANILKKSHDEIIKKFPNWTAAQQLRGAVAAYNFGAKNVQTWGGMDQGTTGDDYSADVWARARYYASLEEFGGTGTIPDVSVPSTSPRSGNQTTTGNLSPAVPAGRLIAQSVGKGGKNNPSDVNAILTRMRALGIISASEAQVKNEIALETYIKRYQGMVFQNVNDGLISPGKLTETKLIQGVLTKPKPPQARTQPRPSTGGTAQRPNVPSTTTRSGSGQTQTPAPDYDKIARQVHYAMFGGYFGLGTDEDSIYQGLGQLKNNATYITAFKQVYLRLHGSDVVADLRSDMSGAELTRALNLLKPSTSGQASSGGRTVAPATRPRAGAGNRDAISTWLAKQPQGGSPGDANKEYATLILEAFALNLVSFNDEGIGNGEFAQGMGGCQDTFEKIKAGKIIGNGKGGSSTFNPKTTAMPIMPVLYQMVHDMVADWDNGGRKGPATKVMLGSFMVWNNNGNKKGQLRTTNHGGAARAIDFNMEGGNDFNKPEAVDFVLNVLKHAPVGNYEIGLPKQGLFIDGSKVSRNHTSIADDGKQVYTKIKSQALRDQIVSMLNAGCKLKVISDNPNHLHFGVGHGGSGYISKNDI